MFFLTLFAFIAGLVTVLSPCILPLLPVILSSSADSSGKRRPLGVILGFVFSFTFFTLFLSTLVKITGIDANSLRLLSVAVLFLFGLSLISTKVQSSLEYLFSKLASHVPTSTRRQGLSGGFLIGISLGLLWTPCVGPILASVISLAIAGTVTAQAFFITLAYAAGTAIPLFGIMLLGGKALQSVPWLVKNTGTIQKIFGVMMIVTAFAILNNWDRRFQTFVLETFPRYGSGLTSLEENQFVQQSLEHLKPSSSAPLAPPRAPSSLKPIAPAPEIQPGGEWFNSTPLTLAGLKGSVVLIDFWTYSCINCQRTLPYLRKWYDLYHQQGLEIIGVHSPEFEFEKNPQNVQQAIGDFGLTYPIVQDNAFATWNAFQNRYWPAKYLIDQQGIIRYVHFGEGKYDETEAAIRELLRQSGASFQSEINNPETPNYAQTPETYLGYKRVDRVVSVPSIAPDQIAEYQAPQKLPANAIAFTGSWLMGEESAQSVKESGLELNFQAKNVYLVMGSVEGGAKVGIFLDGQPASIPGQATHFLPVNEQRLYHLIQLENPGIHQLRIEVDEGVVQFFAFTFG